MNKFVAGFFRLVFRILVVGLGLLLFATLLAAVMALAVVWTLRAGWARLTGRPVTPWVMRMDPRTGFSTVFRSSERWSASRRAGPAAADDVAASRRGGVLPGDAEVTDVQPREVH